MVAVPGGACPVGRMSDEHHQSNGLNGAPAGSPRLSGVATGMRLAEFTALYAIVPLLFVYEVIPLRMLMPFLLVTGLGLAFVLRRDPSFENRRLVNVAGMRGHALLMLGLFAIGAALLTGLTLILEPDRLLGFPLGAPVMYAIVMLFYPLVSVYPQEIIFRTWLFHRYGPAFGSPALTIGASALAFGWAHVFFDANLWVTIGLTVVGGVMFAWTYHRTKSTLACAIEHALYGDFLFTIGLGYYFYTGSVGGG